MSEQLNDSGSWRPKPFLHCLIFAFTALLGIESGAAAFVAVVVFPIWTASPEAVIGFAPDAPYYLEEGDFFMFTSPLTFLLSVITLIAGWRATPPLRMWLRIPTIVFILVFIWSVAYFIPVQDEVKGEAGTKIPYADLESMLQTFVGLNYIRLAALLFVFGCAMHAVGISYRMTIRRLAN